MVGSYGERRTADAFSPVRPSGRPLSRFCTQAPEHLRMHRRGDVGSMYQKPPTRPSLAAYAFMIAISAALFTIARRGDPHYVAGAPVLEGFFSDWSESYPDGRRRTSGGLFSSTNGRITVVGSDDGDHFWTLQGEYIDPSLLCYAEPCSA